MDANAVDGVTSLHTRIIKTTNLEMEDIAAIFYEFSVIELLHSATAYKVYQLLFNMRNFQSTLSCCQTQHELVKGLLCPLGGYWLNLYLRGI